MKVIDYESWSWFLLEEAGTYYLDVHTSSSFVSWSTVIRLTSEETNEYRASGHHYITKLASDIQYYSQDERVTSRNIHGEIGEQVHAAIMSWKMSKKD
jgi:hypothetical protein